MTPPERYGPYLVYEQIAKGGMASVHRAEQPIAGGVRAIALKRLYPTLERQQYALFLDEARLLKHLHHPNIAATYDSGRVFGTYFIAMEHVRGRTLKEVFEQCVVISASVHQAIALDLAVQLCDALDHAHNACDAEGAPLGIIHRDVTPANLIVSETGVLKLIDFGLAKASIMTETTGAGIIKGKYAYVAPEYIGGHLDHRADLWAVGIVMYEILTGRRLFDGADAFETVKRVREMPIPRPSLGNPILSPALDGLVLTALARDPAQRWQTAAAMRDALRAVIAQPGNGIDRADVSAWITRLFQQKRGARAPQLTPMMPMTVTPRSIPIPQMPEEPTVELDPAALEHGRMVPRGVWIAGAGGILVLGIIAILARILA